MTRSLFYFYQEIMDMSTYFGPFMSPLNVFFLLFLFTRNPFTNYSNLSSSSRTPRKSSNLSKSKYYFFSRLSHKKHLILPTSWNLWLLEF